MNLPTFEESAVRTHTVSATKEVTDLFRSTISRLSRFFSIDKASLAQFNFTDHNLHVTHIYKHKRLNKGLTLIVQPTNSAMYQVLMQGYPVADNYPDHMSSHIIERKILLSEATRSLLIIPLTCDCYKLGVLTLSSPDECAFGTYLEGVGEGFVTELATALYINQAAG